MLRKCHDSLPKHLFFTPISLNAVARERHRNPEIAFITPGADLTSFTKPYSPLNQIGFRFGHDDVRIGWQSFQHQTRRIYAREIPDNG
jgi:hypothetical protein